MAERSSQHGGVTYGSVGATLAEDLLAFPPQGFRSSEARARIGHGDARWQYACREVLTWGVQKRSGFDVEVTERATDHVDTRYTPVEFADDGRPVTAATMEIAQQSFTPGGEPYAQPGDAAVLRSVVGGRTIESPVRVVYVLDEPDRKGVAYGTLEGHPLIGEESFIIDRTDDGSVWITVRALSRPASRTWKLASPALHVVQRRTVGRYLRALAGPIS